MSDFIPNENQQRMLEFLLDTTTDSRKFIASAFPMGDREVASERENYRDYLELTHLKLIESCKEGEAITTAGILAASDRTLENPTHVSG